MTSESNSPIFYQWGQTHYPARKILMKEKNNIKLPDTKQFSVKISENMETRNNLRSGLLDAQKNDSAKVPLFVSWPSWLEDGIVCMYAQDLHELLQKSVRNTASMVGKQMSEHGHDEIDIIFAEEPKTEDEPVVNAAHEAARAILEQPLGGGIGSQRPDDGLGGQSMPEEEEIAVTPGSTRDFASSLLNLADDEEEDEPMNAQQSLADELFKKYKTE